MSNNYKDAYHISHSNYPRINWLTAEVILSWYSPGIKNKPLQQDIDQLEKELNQSSDTIDDFWAATALWDFRLLKYLHERTLSAQIESIVSGYQNARNKGATLREFDSVLGHIEFLISMTAIIKFSKERKSALVPLQTIYDGLK